MPHHFVVTTGITAAADTIDRAYLIAAELNTVYIPRRGTGIAAILANANVGFAIVVQSSRLALHDGVTEYFYHPNMLLVRGLNVLRGWRDVFIDAAAFLPGESVLDCTLGFGCEASLAALVVGESGSVTGLESQSALALLTRTGLREFDLNTPPLKAAMGRVNVVCSDYGAFLGAAALASYDVVCFDPFFGERLTGSEHSVSPLARFGDPAPLDPAAVLRARVVARRRVVVKHPRFTELPEDLVAIRTSKIVGRKAQTAYSIFDAAGV